MLLGHVLHVLLVNASKMCFSSNSLSYCDLQAELLVRLLYAPFWKSDQSRDLKHRGD